MKSSEIQFLKVFRYNPIAMVLVEPDLSLAHTNQEFRRLIGHANRDLLGRSIGDLVDGEDGSRMVLRLRRSLDSGSPEQAESWEEFRLLRQDGQTRWIRLNTEEIHDRDGELIYLLLMFEDITERKCFDQEREAYRQRLEHLSRRLLESQEAERRKLARELHDEWGQTLTAIKMGMQAVRGGPGVDGILDTATAEVDRLIRHVRELSLQLRPSVLDDLGLEAALNWLIAQHKRAGMKLDLHVDLDGQRPSAEVETACFRVVQEALTNVRRHAGAEHVEVRVGCRHGQLDLLIRDDGEGFDAHRAQEHAGRGRSLGLLSMEERVSLLGGAFELLSTRGVGTRITARLPLHAGTEEFPSSPLAAQDGVLGT
ncbi:PAS domain-containing sensor histidine kinase [Wenzhouxiangella sp. AB-CW3]|uniref:PAS domain-containing sensor histidine kinase n=1 Tax=Wenzhouxiangella sp. AB-CW3 TaxID=2771012 RepID=UPI00168BA765|nr:PAS domain-containing sensor histidine kinase [Wenzhouxiangella sp. AB-CW3]QOC21210.1 PAS domain-containing sensor histidine kinase [Wenzhouxiangella sp. AB-CW3]